MRIQHCAIQGERVPKPKRRLFQTLSRSIETWDEVNHLNLECFVGRPPAADIVCYPFGIKSDKVANSFVSWKQTTQPPTLPPISVASHSSRRVRRNHRRSRQTRVPHCNVHWQSAHQKVSFNS